MYASRLTIFVLAFVVALASAFPLHNHHRRSKCHRGVTATTSDADVPTPAVAVNVPSSTVGHAAIATSSSAPSKSEGNGKDGKDDEDPKDGKDDENPKDGKDDEDPKDTPNGPPSGSHSSDAPAPTKPASSGGSGSGDVLSGLLGKLFPASSGLDSWTTSPSSGALALSDSTFRPTRVLQGLSHAYTSAPDGKGAMKAHYPKGSYNFGHQPQGGFSFYAPGPNDVDLTTAKEATFGYSVYFPAGFEFQKGGKLPGICKFLVRFKYARVLIVPFPFSDGGNSEDEAVGCSGGRRDNGCFSARLMWRGEGEGEFYTYLPPSFDANKKVCNIKPQSDCNPTYGASVGRGSFHFASGGWTTVSERVRLNDVGASNGELELFVNGKSVINVGGLVLRNNASGKMRGLQMQTFFGG